MKGAFLLVLVYIALLYVTAFMLTTGVLAAAYVFGARW